MSFIGNFLRRFGKYEKEINNSENKYETENVFPASLLRSHNQTKKKKKSFILNGKYGIVFRNYSNPKKVIKAYKHNTNTKKEHNRANRVFKITKNNRQKVQIVQDLQNTDLPINIMNIFSHLNHTNPISAIRMNDLGVNLYTCMIEGNFKQLTKIPVPILLSQFYKLIWQMKQLTDHRVCHRDIKLDNIMIDLETGIMTLIDFDLLRSFDDNIIEIAFVLAEHIEKGTPFTEMIPPEWLIIADIIADIAAANSPILANTDLVDEVLIKLGKNNKLTNEDNKVMSRIDKLSGLYSSNAIMAYYGVTSCISNNDESNNDESNNDECKSDHDAAIIEVIYDNTFKLMKAINAILVMLETEPIPYKKVNESISMDELMSKFDIFGLGGVFSYVLSNLIPHLREEDPNHHLDSAFELAKKMYEYNITKRITPEDALAEMTGILKRTGISPPVFGGRRQTRRR
jgi:serine/threonine protein kinase